MIIEEYLQILHQEGASDLILTAGAPPMVRRDGELFPVSKYALRPEHTEHLARELLAEARWAAFQERGDLDFSFNWQDRARFRVNAFRQRGSVVLTLRLVPYRIPTGDELGLPPVLRNLMRVAQGLILVTGPRSAGKSTTVAALVDQILASRAGHVITIEDPIGYVYRHQKGIVEQREVGSDVRSVADALRAARYQAPDVLLVDELSDLDAIGASLTIAETGHLVLATLHARDTTQAVERMVEVFPVGQQQQVRVQLANALIAVVSQQLLQRADRGGRVAAFEVLLNTPATHLLIREGETGQLRRALESAMPDGMVPMEWSLGQLVRSGMVELAVAAARTQHPEALQRFAA